MISVVVPVYNCEIYISSCIESVIEQTHEDVELVLVNDGSTDLSGDICDKYASPHKKVKVLHTPNKGPAAARNVGIEASSGDYILFLDGDDFLSIDAIETLISAQKSHKIDFIIGNFNKVNNSNASDYAFNSKTGTDKRFDSVDILQGVIKYLQKPNSYSPFTYTWGKLFSAEVIKSKNLRFNERLRTFEDWSFVFRYLKNIESALLIKEPIYNYRLHDGTESAGMKIYGDQIEYAKIALQSAVEYLVSRGVDKTIAEKETDNTLLTHTIITMVRASRNFNFREVFKFYTFFKTIVRDEEVTRALRNYNHRAGHSKLIPLLMRIKQPLPLMFVCAFRAMNRYGK